MICGKSIDQDDVPFAVSNFTAMKQLQDVFDI